MGESGRCKAIKDGGQRCRASAQLGQDWCWNHDPDRANERRENASAGGKARSRRSPDELETIKAQVRGIASGVFQGTIDKGTAAVLGQLYNTLLRSIEIQRKLDHQREHPAPEYRDSA